MDPSVKMLQKRATIDLASLDSCDTYFSCNTLPFYSFGDLSTCDTPTNTTDSIITSLPSSSEQYKLPKSSSDNTASLSSYNVTAALPTTIPTISNVQNVSFNKSLTTT